MAFVGITNKRRIAFILFCCLLVFIVIFAKLVYIQVIKAEYFQEQAYSQQTKEREVEAKRGTIYDTTGNKVLAQSVSTSKVVLFPTTINNKEEVGQKLSEILELKLDVVMNKLNKSSSSETLATNVSDDKIQKLLEYVADEDISGIKIDEDTSRVYPYGTLLAHSLGFTGTDNQGLYGLEAYYDEELTGISGKIVGSFDGEGNETPYTNEQYVEPQNGMDLVLTIDATIQSIAEKYIKKAYEENFIYKLVNSNLSPRFLAIGVMVLCGSLSVYAYINASSSVYSLHVSRILSDKAMILSVSLPESRITDIGHFTIPAFTAGYFSILNSVSTGAFAIAN